jgi:hypothetical protein
MQVEALLTQLGGPVSHLFLSLDRVSQINVRQVNPSDGARLGNGAASA